MSSWSEIRLTHSDQKVNGLTAVVQWTAVRRSKFPSEYRWNLSRSNVLYVKHGKPYSVLRDRSINLSRSTARKTEYIEGKGCQKKRRSLTER